MVLIDTNILAYLLIQGDRTKEVQSLYTMDPEWRSDAFLLIEFSNILVTYQRLAALTIAQATHLLQEAESRLPGLINVSHILALDVARRFGVSAYDARFLAAAESMGIPLTTEDNKLRAAAPSLTRSLRETLSAY